MQLATVLVPHIFARKKKFQICTINKQKDPQLTLYSKQDTHIVRSSSSLLSWEGGISTVQRWIRLRSAFFITQRKQTSRWRLVSAAKVATDLPCWEQKEDRLKKYPRKKKIKYNLE